MNLEEAKKKLEQFGQLHVLKYFDEISEAEKAELLQQIDETDFAVLENCKNLGKSEGRGEFKPLAALQVSEIEQKKEEFTKIGVKALKEGKVAACLLAGGMGTRLGSDNPKGMYDIGLTKPVFIFQRIIENLLDTVNQADGAYIRLFIMTSEKNNDATISLAIQRRRSHSSSRTWLQLQTMTERFTWRVREGSLHLLTEMPAGILQCLRQVFVILFSRKVSSGLISLQ